MSLDVQITFDCADPGRLAHFWAEALAYKVQEPPAGFDTWQDALRHFGVPEERWNSRSAIVPVEGDGPRLFFQQVPEGKTAKNRVHLDVRAAEGMVGEERMATLQTKADLLVEHGATISHRVEPDPHQREEGFIVMWDPEGNEFCLD